MVVYRERLRDFLRGEGRLRGRICLKDLHFLDDSRSLLYQYSMAAVGTPDSAVLGLYFNFALAPNAFVNREITSHFQTCSFSSFARRIERATVLPTEVSGRYAPPANVVWHFAHTHIPVPFRDTAFRPHAGHLCAWCIASSTSAILLRILRPYRGPNRPAERVFLPFLRAPFLTIR